MMVGSQHKHSQDYGRSQVHMSEQLKKLSGDTILRLKEGQQEDYKTGCPTEFNETNSSNCFTTYVVMNMKSPHLLSPVHDLAICTRSAQMSHKEEDFMRPIFHTDRIDRAAVQTILADLMSAIPHHTQ